MRQEAMIFNNVIGTASSYDDINYLVYQYYDFIPNEGFDIPACAALCVDYENGSLDVYLDTDSGDDPDIRKNFMIVMNDFISIDNYSKV